MTWTTGPQRESVATVWLTELGVAYTVLTLPFLEPETAVLWMESRSECAFYVVRNPLPIRVATRMIYHVVQVITHSYIEPKTL